MLPTFGGTQRLARLIGRKRALRMILTGQPISAEEALALGLVNAVVPHDRLLDETRRLALAIAAKAPSAVRACLGSVTQGRNMGIAQGRARPEGGREGESGG